MSQKIIVPKNYPMEGHELKKIISYKDIEEKIINISSDINEKYTNKRPIIICVLNGAFMFFADLLKKIEILYEIDFIKISSYENNIFSTKKITLEKEINVNIIDRDIIIIEDIIDTGLSINYLIEHFKCKKPRSISIATLLYKNKSKISIEKIDWIGFNIDDQYVVGYGLDLSQIYRGLPNIYVINK